MIDMSKLPDGCGLMEVPCTIIHGGPYKVLMDGLDCYIYEMAADQTTMKLLCKMPGAELTQRLGTALLRAAHLQRLSLTAGQPLPGGE